MLALSLITSHTCLCGLAVAARAMLQQRRGRNVCVQRHLDVNILYVRYIAYASNLWSSICVTYNSCLLTSPPV